MPLPEIPFPGHTYQVVSMDYNLFANQTSGVSSAASLAPQIEQETYWTLLHAFRLEYRGERAPFVYGSHFETWNHGAYNRALRRFLLAVCRLPDVRCVSYRELVDWLDAHRTYPS